MTVRRIVMGVDYSSVTIRSATWVQNDFAPGAELILVHAAETSPVPSYARALLAGRGDPAEMQLDDERHRLESWRTENGLKPGLSIVREGRPDEVLNAVVRECNAELLVIGAHGDKPPRFHIGSTADRILREARGSILVARGQMTAAPQRIVVALDDAAITPRVLAIAGDLADQFDARLHAVHVLSNAAYSHGLSMEAATTSSEREKRKQLDEDLNAEADRWMRALWRDAGRRERVDVEIRHGSAGDELLAAAGAINADLLVIGRYGAGRIIPAMLGSTVGAVIHGAQCPVLVVADVAT